VKRSPAKLRKLEKRAAFRRRQPFLEKLVAATNDYNHACIRAFFSEENVEPGVVCETCWLEQPYVSAPTYEDRIEPCVGALGLNCPGEICITVEHYRELCPA
jgi:hypothetical protein